MNDHVEFADAIVRETMLDRQQNDNGEQGFDPKDQYLTFLLNDELYGVSILRVEEIRGWEPATQIPNAPRHVIGVINIRGTIVPIFDLRTRFGLEQVAYGANTVTIILRVIAPASDGTRRKIMGIVVDAVSDVHVFSQSDIQFSPDTSSSGANTGHIHGVVDANDKMAILLDVDKVMLEG